MDIEYTPLLQKTIDSKARTIVHVGGAGSSKSHTLAQLMIFKLCNEQSKRIGICRKTFKALRMTALDLVKDLLVDYQIYNPNNHNKTEHTYSFPKTNSRIQFFGVDEPEKIKSANFNYIWMEEGNEFTYDDYMVLKLRLRHPTVNEPNQMFISLNPVDENGWIPTKLSKEEEVEFIHSTYEDNPFLSTAYRKTIENLINEDENYYRVYALGEWGKLENLIYRNWKVVDSVPEIREAMAYGLDFGLVNPSALIKISLCNREIYLEERLYKSGLTNKDIIEALSHEEKGDIYADPSALQMIEEIYRAGHNIYPALKDVAAGIGLCKRQILNITKDSVNLIKEIQGYQHKKDKDGNILDEPVKFHDHACDAMRYAISGLTERYGYATARPSGGKYPVKTGGVKI